MSETWDTLVPEAAPRYSTLAAGLMWMLSTPAITAAAARQRCHSGWALAGPRHSKWVRRMTGVRGRAEPGASGSDLKCVWGDAGSGLSCGCVCTA